MSSSAQPLTFQIATAKIVAEIDAEGEAGFILSDCDAILVEAVVLPIDKVLAIVVEAGALNTATRLRCERPPCGHVFIVLVVEGYGFSLLTAPRAQRVNAPGSKVAS